MEISKDSKFISRKLYSIILIFYFCISLCEANEVRKINPPRLDEHNIKQQIRCYRPMRHGSPAMFLEKKDKKMIIHNYGHGGSGLTLAPGSAKYVVDLFSASNVSKDTPIVVLGAGVIGLFTALELVERNYSNVTVMAASFDKLTSHNAGGLLAPASMNNDPEVQPLIDKIGIESYAYYKDIALKKHSKLKKGAKIMTTYFGTRETSTLEPYVKLKVMDPAKDVLLDFQNGTQRKMIAYDDGIYIDADSLMNELKSALKDRVIFKKETIQNLMDIKQAIVFNCTGMGSKILANDPKMIPVQGHLILLKNQNPKDINYMMSVYVQGGKTSSGLVAKRKCSLFPKHEMGSNSNDIGVIGGTFIEGADELMKNSEQFEIELKNAKEFFGITKNEESFFYN